MSDIGMAIVGTGLLLLFVGTFLIMALFAIADSLEQIALALQNYEEIDDEDPDDVQT